MINICYPKCNYHNTNWREGKDIVYLYTPYPAYIDEIPLSSFRWQTKKDTRTNLSILHGMLPMIVTWSSIFHALLNDILENDEELRKYA